MAAVRPSVPPRRRRPRAPGTATIEFCAIAPFVVALLAVVWDLRAFVAHRTDLARETYVAVEAIADAPDALTAPFEAVLGEDGPLGARLRHERVSVAGFLQAAIIVRGTTRHDGSACPADAWCPPVVRAAWPDDVDAAWSDGTASVCLGTGTLPPPGARFAVGETVLPDEDPAQGGVPTPESTWISRNMTPTEWWVVLDVCLQPVPGAFTGRLTQLSVEMLDLPFAVRRRIAWGSVHDLGDCQWC